MAAVDLRLASREQISRIRAHALDAALVATSAMLMAESMFFVFFAYLNRDEGWYLLSGRLALQGELPYRDFPYFQAPLLPYVFGAGASVFGSSLIGARMFCAVLAMASAALVLYIGERLRSRATGVLATLILVCTPSVVLGMVTPRAEAIVIPLTLLAFALLLTYRRGVAGLVAAPAVLLLASAARLTFLPAFIAVAVFCYWRARPSRREFAAGSMMLAGLGVTLSLTFIVAAPHQALFDVWTAQQARNAQFEGSHSFLHVLTDRIGVLSVPAYQFFAVIIPAMLVLVLLHEAYQRGWRPDRTRDIADDVWLIYAVIIGLTLLLWVPFAGFDHQEDRYFLPSFPLLAILAADVIVRGARGPLGGTAHAITPVLVVLLSAHALFQFAGARDLVDSRDVPETQEVGKYIGGMMSPDDQLVAFDPTLAVAADRTLAPPLLMGQFSFWPYLSDAAARGAGVVNANLLEDLMLDPRTKVIALDDYDLKLIATARDESLLVAPDAAWPYKLFPILIGRFEVVRRVPNFGQFSGTLYVLERVGA